MNREKLIEMLESDAITEDDPHASTNDAGHFAEGVRAVVAVAKIREKRTKSGHVYGVRKEDKAKRLTGQMQSFVNGILSGMTAVDAYRASYNVRTSNEATLRVAANRLLRDARISALLGSLDEALAEKVIADAVRTRRFVMERLHARVLNAKTQAIELKALELMGRAVAMFTDTVDQTVRQVNIQQLKSELKAHLTLIDSVTPPEKRSA